MDHDTALQDAPAPALTAAVSARVFTMPASAAFLPALARGVVALTRDDVAGLAGAVILAPTRRASRALSGAFLDVSGAGAAVLPQIRALGDVEVDEPPFAFGAHALDIPVAFSPQRRRFDLAALLHAKAVAGDPDADPAASLGLADVLAGVLDDVVEAGGDLAALTELYTHLPTHLQEAATFLDIVQNVWPARLAELGMVHAVERRAALLRTVADHWRVAPPQSVVIAAGSTGSTPATATLLDAVARAPRGYVVLPGLDRDLDQAAWDAIDEQHPQAGMKRLLGALGVDRRDVADWPYGADEPPAAAARRRVLSEALRPADATVDWRARLDAAGAQTIERGLEGLAVCVAPDEHMEARVAALAVRHLLEETPDARTLIVTPDAGLAKRVALALERWGIAADNSAGAPLPQTPAGGFLAHILALANDPGDPVALCALIKHPLFGLGRSEGALAAIAPSVETAILRGVRAGADMAAWRRRLKHLSDETCVRESLDRAAADALLADVEEAFEPLLALAERDDLPLAEVAEAHIRVAEALAATADYAGAQRVWAGRDGEAAAGLLRSLLTESAGFPASDGRTYARVYDGLARGVLVRPEPPAEARVRILGPLEARLLSADLVILCGLNEGVWPTGLRADPLMSRGMRLAAGLSPPERDTGRAAHDFAQLAAAPRVLLTRSARVDGAPSVASRWLWRLKTVCDGAGARLEEAASPTRVFGVDYLSVAERLDAVAPQDVRPAPAPEPRPPVSARPRRASATDIGRWIRDPYAFYAKRVLRLAPLDPLDRPLDARDRGIAIHDALHEVLADAEGTLSTLAERLTEAALRRLRAQGLSADVLAREAARMARAAAWFAAWEQARRAMGWRPAGLEIAGARTLTAPAGAFTLNARADRIDVREGEAAAVLDYKTGAPPSPREVKAGLEPQLSLEAAILMAGGFNPFNAPGFEGGGGQGLEPDSRVPDSLLPNSLVYVRWSGGRVPGAARDVSSAHEEGAAGLADEAWEGLTRLVARFDHPQTPYRAQIMPKTTTMQGDYDRLARRKEWSAAVEEAG